MPKKPNIIFVTIDALRADQIGHLGCPDANTLNIDELAKEGISFSNAMANGPTTPSSFPSIAASKYCLMCNLPDRYGGISIDGVMTLAEILRSAGYRTAGFHSNLYLTSTYEYDQGFDAFYDLVTPDQTRLYIDRQDDLFGQTMNMLSRFSSKFCYLRAWIGTHLFRKHSPRVSPCVSAEQINRSVKSWLKSTRHRPFFLWVHYMEPHYPYMLPPNRELILEYLKIQYKVNHNPSSLSDDEIAFIRRRYAASIRSVDVEVGKLLDTLYKFNVTNQNTFFVITSDHGEEFGEHGGFYHGAKLFNELLHVPLIIRGLDLSSKLIVSEPVGLIDLPPTLLDLIGIDIPTSFQGNSLIPLFQTRQKTRTNWSVFSEYATPCREVGYAIRKDAWKYILTLTRGGHTDALYNLSEDPFEKNNLALNEQSLASDLKQKLMTHIQLEEKARKVVARFRETRQKQARMNGHMKKRLRELGYL